MTLSWVRGIPADREVVDWCLDVVAWLRNGLANLPTSPTTSAAETGLGLAPSAYWYIGCANAAFCGQGVSLWAGPESPKMATGGISPFDTGGLFHGYISPAPGYDPTMTLAYFLQCDRPLSQWPSPVCQDLRASYADFALYVHGHPPTHPVTPLSHAHHTDSRAWTWEGRIEKATVSMAEIYVRRFYWRQEDRNSFEYWLHHDSGEPLPDAIAILRLADHLGNIVETPYQEVTSDLAASA